ncbi:hypothetical protein K435DRAFT_966374 [Dendrothele bispora CBS 962.96]|uniref:Uncharacterized protein n=1 Tax=Dendrothele bispora (strain CBS 962.96) TaxID=1314807 RepID=A0A4S8M0E3_DENBC|nr:hypothetical protein K435DRAFT_966374 [Dendrothele bispora CBS 962.96]
MSTSINLDDPNQSVFFIPCAESDDEEQQIQEEEVSELLYGDLPNGDEIRWEAYRAAWTKCLDRVQALSHALYAPVVAQVVNQINNAYDETLLGLPREELPFIAVSNTSSNTSFLAAIVTKLGRQETPSYITHLHPSECPNITTAMRTLVNGFITQSTGQKYASSARSLAPYDIRVLEAWYATVENAGDAKRNLVLIIHDFEQIDPNVMQDIIYICSLYIPKLPLVFCVSLSSPEMPSYLHLAYTRSTLTLLRLHRFTVPSGSRLLEEVFMKTFVDLEYEPPLVLGPAELEFLLDYCTRYNCSVDVILNILQLAHLKHFMNHIPSLLFLSTPASSILKEPPSFSFLETIMARLHTPGDEDNVTPSRAEEEVEVKDWEITNISSFTKTVDSARLDFYRHCQKMRFGFKILRTIDGFLVARGYKGLDWERIHGPGIARIFVEFLKGGLTREVKGIRLIISKLRQEELEDFLDELGHLFDELPQSLADSERGAKDEFERFVKDYNDFKIGEGSQVDENESQNTKQLAGKVSLWASNYIRSEFLSARPLEGLLILYRSKLADIVETTCFLWDVWYTGMTPFPSEILNPSVRASIISGLLNPKEFRQPLSPPVFANPEDFLFGGKTETTKRDDNNKDEGADEGLWEMPDTSILFHRYLESGKMINVYDWYQSFHDVLEIQRKKIKRQEREREKNKTVAGQSSSSKKNGTPSPKKRGRPPLTDKGKGKDKRDVEELVEASATRGRSKGKGKARENQASDGEKSEHSEEKWNLEVQARFMRALHELDYLGFIKHTGRKPDHVLRTAFDVTE